MNRSFIATLGALAWVGSLHAGTPALDTAMAAWAKEPTPPRYRYALTDLNGDSLLDAVVLVNDPDYCGSGGCTFLVLKGVSGGTFAVVNRSTVTREPIYLLQEQDLNWSALSVQVSGGGAEPGQAVLRFDGKVYPSNPTTQPRATPAQIAAAQLLKLQ